MKKRSTTALFFWLLPTIFIIVLLYEFLGPSAQVKFDAAQWKTSGKDKKVRYSMAQDAARIINGKPTKIRELLEMLGEPDTVDNRIYRYDLGVRLGSIMALNIHTSDRREIAFAAVERIR